VDRRRSYRRSVNQAVLSRLVHGGRAIDHRDVFPSDRQRAEGAKFCACVSRAVGGAISIDIAYRGEGAAILQPRLAAPARALRPDSSAPAAARRSKSVDFAGE
jgi:hypothetical protein